MKILAISLLRIGDSLFHSECLSQFMRQSPNAVETTQSLPVQLDFLIHDQFAHTKALYPHMNKLWFFPRAKTENILKKRTHIFEKAVKEICDLADAINQEKYDVIINLTHHQTSARFMDMLEAQTKKGPQYKNGKAMPAENAWDDYFQETFKDSQEPVFHYVDFLKQTLNLQTQPKNIQFPNKIQRVAIQPLTSDAKKNWPLQKFQQLADKLKAAHKEVVILCAPNEETLLKPLFTHKIIACDFIDARAQLKQSDLLISGDTSMLHLANQEQKATISLFIGSANPYKTAPYGSNHYILQGKSECSPCGHDFVCNKNFACHDSISVENVLHTINLAYADSISDVKVYSKNNQILKTKISDHGFLSFSETQSWLQYLIATKLNRGERMSKETEQKYRDALAAIEKEFEVVKKTNPYNAETAKMQMIYELIKEQVKNEDTSHSTSTTR